MNMNLSNYLSSILVFCLFFTACRNAPDLPNDKPWDKTVKVRLPSDPKILHVLDASDSESTQVLHQIFLPLADFNPVTYELMPVLIKALPKITKITEGENAGLVAYEYEIREEVTWANGSPITGKDYLFTVKAMFNPHKRSFYTSQFKDIVKIQIDAANPKRFTLFSLPYMMGLRAYTNTNPLPAYLYDPKGILANYTLNDLMDNERLLDKVDLKELGEAMYSLEFIRSPEILQGSGAYQLEEWITGQQLVLKKITNWWGDKVKNGNRMLKAVPEKIIYKIIPEENAAISLMANEELDIITSVNWTTFLDQKKKIQFTDKYNFYNPDIFGIRMMYFNTLTEKLSDKKVRRAIAHLMNRQEIFNTVFYGYPVPVDQPTIPAAPAYNKELPFIDFNVVKAKQLLKEAGWEDTNNDGVVDKVINGERINLEIDVSYSTSNADNTAVVDIFKSNALEAGVKLRPQALAGKVLLTKIKSRDFDITYVSSSGYPFNLDPESKWSSRSPKNYSGFGTAESDQLIQEIKTTIDVEKQNELFKKLYAIIYEEQPCLFIGVDKDRIIVNKKFGDITAHGFTPGFLPHEFDGNARVLMNKN